MDQHPRSRRAAMNHNPFENPFERKEGRKEAAARLLQRHRLRHPLRLGEAPEAARGGPHRGPLEDCRVATISESKLTSALKTTF